MRDNVTPFRPRRPPQKPKGGGLNIQSHRGKAVLAQTLTLAAFVLTAIWPLPPLSYFGLAVAVAAVAVAVSNRGQSMPWASTHHEHALRTLLFGYTVTVLVSVTGLLLPPGMTPPDVTAAVGLMQIWTPRIVLIWAGIRSGVGIVLAIMRRPIWHPTGLLL